MQTNSTTQKTFKSKKMKIEPLKTAYNDLKTPHKVKTWKRENDKRALASDKLKQAFEAS